LGQTRVARSRSELTVLLVKIITRLLKIPPQACMRWWGAAVRIGAGLYLTVRPVFTNDLDTVSRLNVGSWTLISPSLRVRVAVKRPRREAIPIDVGAEEFTREENFLEKRA